MSQWFQNRQKQSLIVLLLVVVGMIYMATRGDEDSPEEQVRKAVREMVVAAENKELGPFRKHLSEDVRDERGNGKQELINILRGIFFRHHQISLSLISMDVDDNTNPNIIAASLTLLMGESMIPSDKGNFFLTFRNEGGIWRVWELKWQDGYGI